MGAPEDVDPKQYFDQKLKKLGFDEGEREGAFSIALIGATLKGEKFTTKVADEFLAWMQGLEGAPESKEG